MTDHNALVEVLAGLGSGAAVVGLVMVTAAAISLATKRLLRMSDETLSDPWFRRHDTSGLSWAIHWMRPGLVVLTVGLIVALIGESVQ